MLEPLIMVCPRLKTYLDSANPQAPPEQRGNSWSTAIFKLFADSGFGSVAFGG